MSVDVLRRWVDDGTLTEHRSAGGQRLVEGTELARLAATLAAGGGDEAVTAGAGSRISARNRFEGLVTRVVVDEVMAQIEIQAGPHRLVSLMTAEAALALGLKPGVAAAAVVKSTNVIVELAGPARLRVV